MNRNWAVLALALGPVVGCGSSDDAVGSASSAGSSGQAASAGRGGSDSVESPTAGGVDSNEPESSETAGAGGSSGDGPAHDDREQVATFECDDPWFTELDEDAIYYTCLEPDGGEFSSKKVFALRELLNGETEPTVLATSEKPIRFLTRDADAYYVQEFGSFDDNHNTFRGYIRRLDQGATELTDFATASDLGGHVTFVSQTDDYVLVAQHISDTSNSSKLYSYRKSDAKPAALGDDYLSGAASCVWESGRDVSWVMSGDITKIYSAPLAGGAVTEGAELPDLCSWFQPTSDGLIAFCRNQTSKAFDLAHLSIDGDVDVLLRSAASQLKGGLYVRDRIYWPGGDDKAPTIEAVDDAGERGTRQFSADWRTKTLTEHYAYSVRTDDTKTIVERVPLTEVR